MFARPEPFCYISTTMKNASRSSILGSLSLLNLSGSESGSSTLRILGGMLAAAFLGFLLIGIIIPPEIWPHERKQAMRVKASVEEAMLQQSIAAYCQTYGHFPVSTNVQQYAAEITDVTYGGVCKSRNGTHFTMPPGTSGSILSNSEVVTILMDFTKSPTGETTINADHGLIPTCNQCVINVRSGQRCAHELKSLPGRPARSVARCWPPPPPPPSNACNACGCAPAKTWPPKPLPGSPVSA